MDWLPKHKCELTLSHNAHKSIYETVESYADAQDFISETEYLLACDKDELWEIQWYPDTPVGFYRACASSLNNLKELVKLIEEREEL